MLRWNSETRNKEVILADEDLTPKPGDITPAPGTEDKVPTPGANDAITKEGDETPKPGDFVLTDHIPTEYKDKAYLKDVNDLPSLFKKLDGAETLLGKKETVIPGADATEEQVTEFYNKLRPESADKYELTVTDKSNPKFIEGIKDLLHKTGQSPRQAKALQEGFDGLVANIVKEQGLTTEQQDVDFEKLATETFGKNSEAALETAKKLIAAHAPESMKEHTKNLSNENLIIMAGVLNSISQKYISEDDLSGMKGGDIANTESIASLQAEGRKLMASPAYQSKFHADHAVVDAKVKEIYARVGKLKDAGHK